MNKFLYLLTFFVTLNIHAQVDVTYDLLVWSDDFDGNGAIDNTKWFHQTQLPAGGSWFNGEVQHYTDLTTNSYVSNGTMKIVAKKEVYTNQGVTKNYTSARLNSKFAFKYGRIDVRAKIPVTQGTWPAIWMLGKNINEDGAYWDASYGTTNWPNCGEIDIMEHGIFPGQPTTFIQGAVHTPSSYGNTVNKGGTNASAPDTSFHIYSMNWSPNQITFLLDGVAYYTYNPTTKNASTWPFDKEQYVLLNVAMGGIAGAIDPQFSQDQMEIDYVKIYQNAALATNEIQVQEDRIIDYDYRQHLISVNPKADVLSVQIYDASGRLMKKFSSPNASISMKNYPKGVYFVEASTSTKSKRIKVLLP